MVVLGVMLLLEEQGVTVMLGDIVGVKVTEDWWWRCSGDWMPDVRTDALVGVKVKPQVDVSWRLDVRRMLDELARGILWVTMVGEKDERTVGVVGGVV